MVKDMNETIGEKGGRRDRKRTIIITSENKKKLKEYNIRLLAEDCGRNYGRTVEFYSETGDYVIKSVGKPVKTI